MSVPRMGLATHNGRVNLNDLDESGNVSKEEGGGAASA